MLCKETVHVHVLKKENWLQLWFVHCQCSAVWTLFLKGLLCVNVARLVIVSQCPMVCCIMPGTVYVIFHLIYVQNICRLGNVILECKEFFSGSVPTFLFTSFPFPLLGPHSLNPARESGWGVGRALWAPPAGSCRAWPPNGLQCILAENHALGDIKSTLDHLLSHIWNSEFAVSK